MSTSIRRTRNVTVIGGGLIDLSTAINIQENVPDVNVEVVVDVGCNAMTACLDSSKAIKGFEASSPTSTKSENTTDNHFSNTGYPADDEGCSLMVDIVKDDHDIGAASLSTPELSFSRSPKTWSNDDVIWLPQSVPGLDDTTGRGGYYRFWSVLTWYHLYEMTQRESSLKTGVRLLSNYKLDQWKDNQVSDWWKDLVPDYRQLHNEPQDQSASGLRYSRSFTTVVMNEPQYLQYLSERFLSCGGRLRGGHNSSSSNELSGPRDLLVNCSGINIDELSGGAKLQAVQSLKLQPITSIQASNSTQCCQFADIRLETDIITHKGRLLPVVHNYGYDPDHVITLHWGCAQEAARLASDILAGRSIGLTSKL